MLSNLRRAFQALNCWKYCCFSLKAAARKELYSTSYFFIKKTPTNQPTHPRLKDILATTLKSYPSHKQNKHFFVKVPLIHQKILLSYTENTIQTKADRPIKL